MQFLRGFWLIVKGNDYYSVHRKFQVHSTNIFVLGAKQISQGDNHPSLPLTLTAYPTPTPRWVVNFLR